jgi:5'-nucleotidase
VRRLFLSAGALLALAGCAVQQRPPQPVLAAEQPIAVQILAINDFHGNLQPSADPVTVVGPNGQQSARLGGAAELASALEQARRGHRNSITVAAGDLIGASPLESAYFLDEPTVEAMTILGLSVASVGNHEFDKGSSELLRMQRGGCQKYTSRVPCRLERFQGAGFEYLSANVLNSDGTTLFPATAIRQVGPIRIGFIGETLKGTGLIVTPSGVAGLHFADEAETANALVPTLKAEGADAIVLLIHQGGKLPGTYRLGDCDGLSGDILPILDKLDPAITTVISAHTHNAYSCTVDAGGAKRLLTSAGKYGYLYTDVELRFDPSTRKMISEAAANVPVAATGGVDPKIESLVKRYVDAAAPAAARIVGHLPGPLTASLRQDESPAADLVADAQLAATRDSARGGAHLSFINTGGVRTSLLPAQDGSITYGQIFAMEPFGNDLVVKTFTGAQLKQLLEQQFREDNGKAVLRDSILIPSANFRFAYDLTEPVGERIVSMRLDGKAIDPNGTYRVAVNNFLASGGDGYSVLAEGADAFDAGLDLDALEAWLATDPAIPSANRVRNVTPAG